MCIPIKDKKIKYIILNPFAKRFKKLKFRLILKPQNQINKNNHAHYATKGIINPLFFPRKL
jgi:hypothetical protein